MDMTTASNARAASAGQDRIRSVRRFFRTLFSRRIVIFGFVGTLFFVLVAIFAPLIAQQDPNALVDMRLRPASPEHPFGTDYIGRDMFARVVYGTRVSLLTGVISVLMSAFVGVFLGMCAAYFGGAVDRLIMRFIDMIQCVPGMLLTICISVALGSGIVNTVIAMSFGGIWGTARMLRGQILTVRTSEYVEAAKATNNSSFRTIVKYVLPNSIQQTVISACMGIGGAISGISGLSFLGLGVQPPLPEWGAMLSDGRNYLRYYPNMLWAPCIVIALTILSISFFGDGLRDAMDPRMKD